MAVTFTQEQQKVIDLRDRNILVSAAAGSGKTAVLVERIIQMISDEERKVDIDRLLVVTFTNAAAAEMRERISRAIEAKLEETPENEHLQRQAALLHNAQITTIDSFCLFIIRNNFNDIGLDPAFRVADEGELKLLKQDMVAELLEECYEEKSEAFLSCVEYFTGGSNDKLLEEYILKLYEFSMSYPWPEEWLEDRKKDYEIACVTEMEQSAWCAYITGYIKMTLGECIRKLERALDLTQEPAGPYFYGDLLEREVEMLQMLAERERFSELYEGWHTISFGRLSSKKDESVDEELCRRAQNLRNQVKKQIEELTEAYFVLSPERIVDRMKQAKEPVSTLLELVCRFKEKVDERKRRENMIDFADMEHFALNILIRKEDGEIVTTPAAKEYRRHFYEILIDEYQDSNLVQELLLQSISGEEDGNYNRFMVGDVKQSIYKFRLARPELFIEKYTCYTKIDSNRQRIDLHKNFRSRQEVLDSVNGLFYRIMGHDLGGVEYDEDAALYPGAVFPNSHDNQTETYIIAKASDNRLSVREQEALVVARKIKKLIRDFMVTDKLTGELRPAEYRDIVILLRTTAGWAEDFKRVFEMEGVPAYVASRTGYFKAPEVREVLGLLHVLDNPRQDIPLYGLMKSFFGGFSEEEIALIRGEGDKGNCLYEDLMKYVREERKTELMPRVADFLVWVKQLRKRASYTPIHTLIQKMMTDTGYVEYISSKPGGEQRRANVEMLLTKAAAFENTSYYGLFHFLRYIKQLEKYQVDYGEADILDENANVVRIMSIHKSKGLEFPICFVSGLAKKFNRQDTAGRLIADMDMGIGVDYVDSRLRIQSKTMRKNAVAMKMKLDSLGEELRVFYVAMTRAREKLFLTAVVNDLEKWQENYEENKLSPGDKASFSMLAESSCFLDFIAPCMEEINWIMPDDVLRDELCDEMRVSGQKQALLTAQPDEKTMTEVSQKIKRTYPYQYLSDLFIKTTVSELKKAAYETVEDGDGFSKDLFEEPEVIPYIPGFIKEKEELSGTDRGSAYHKVMELLDFKKFYCGEEERQTDRKSEVVSQIDSMEKSEKLNSQWRKAVSKQKVTAFMESELAKRMAYADRQGKLYKEQPFVLGLSANRIKESFPENEMVLIQGIIDVYFEEEDGLVVADYKTDKVFSDEELIARYKVQLDYYAEALERLTGKAVKEKVIYSFALLKEIFL